MSILVVVAVVAIAALIVPSALYLSNEEQNIAGKSFFRSIGGSPGGGYGNSQNTCKNECASGQSICVSASTERVCGQFDNDKCLEWKEQECLANESCQNNECREAETQEEIFLSFEAEGASLAGPLVIKSDAKASGGKFIIVPNGKDDGKGIATFTFTIKEPGEYHIWGRVKGETDQDNGFVERSKALNSHLSSINCSV